MKDATRFRKDVTQPFMRLRRAMEDKPWIETIVSIKSPLAAAPLRTAIDLSDPDLAESWRDILRGFWYCAQKYRRLDRRNFVPNRTAFATNAYERFKECRSDLRKDMEQRMTAAVDNEGTDETRRAAIAGSTLGSLMSTPQATVEK